MRRTSRWLPALAGLVLVVAGACSGAEAPEGAVHVVPYRGAIDPIGAQFLDRAIDRAEDSRAGAIVIELDTPGGLDSSMRDIVQRIERSKVPVVVYVSPSGARAASAGTFITMAASVAAMAPGTTIGAASAINSDGSDIGGTLGRKIENDAAAYIRGLADLHGRNADWAEQAVREAVAASDSEALNLGVVDLRAGSLDELLRSIEGREVYAGGTSGVRLGEISQAPRVNTGMTVWERVLKVLANPTLASLLLTLGVLALLAEIANPGMIVPGATGVVAIALALLGFGVLPVEMVGILLLAIGIAMIGAELFVPGGILGIAGAVVVVVGAIVAFRDTPADFRPPIWVGLLIAGLFAVIFAGIALATVRGRRNYRPTVGAGLVGKTAVADSDLRPEGWVIVDGKRWEAALDAGGDVSAGQHVRVVGRAGTTLRVQPDEP